MNEPSPASPIGPTGPATPEEERRSYSHYRLFFFLLENLPGAPDWPAKPGLQAMKF